jgi:hypothetical protein
MMIRQTVVHTSTAEVGSHSNDIATATNDTESNELEHQTFGGYIYPDNNESVGKASRTELYQCHKCALGGRLGRSRLGRTSITTESSWGRRYNRRNCIYIIT